MVLVDLLLGGVMQMYLLRVDVLKLFCFNWDELEITINYLLGVYLLVCEAAGFIYRNEVLKLAKSLFKSVNCLDVFDLQNDYRISDAFFGGC